MIGSVIYLFCALASLACAALLLRSWMRTPVRLIFWTSLCFIALAVNGALLFFDLALFPQGPSLAPLRNLSALIGVGTLIYGLITETT